MKILLLSGLLFISTLNSDKSNCDNIQLELSITNTTDNKDNGRIDVVVMKGEAPFRVFLFGANREDNLEDVKFKDLRDLKKGEYILVVQDNGKQCTYRQNVKIN